MTVQRFTDYLLISKRYKMYTDGVIYDTLYAKDIPQWIFEFRDFVKENAVNIYD